MSAPARTYGSCRVRLDLEDLEKSADNLDVGWDPARYWFNGYHTPKSLAALWAREDVLNDIDPHSDQERGVQARKQQLAGVWASVRARRASNLADLAWGERTYGLTVDSNRRAYHQIRELVRCYNAELAVWAKQLRKAATALSKPAPAPKARVATAPPAPFRITQDHLEARLLDIFGVRAVVTAGERKIHAVWDRAVSVDVLRDRLGFILEPARFTLLSATEIELTW